MALERNEFFPLFVLKLGVRNKSEFHVYLLGILNPIKFKIAGQFILLFKISYINIISIISRLMLRESIPIEF
jgi:hypothetical protein